ncbi:MAG: hypothetical protein A2068_08260 [Ignavibacteria bacterium GWB2_35_6b]|nr:MAG: hypothetical protein A2068_08260 [Ignavibacteria bacterium GWB2_35_6b]
MIKSYIKTAFRNIRKNKTTSFINISGLALGITCFIIIGLYVFSELSFDKYHSKADRIFRIGLSLKLNDIIYNEATLQFPAAKVLTEDYPEIEKVVRFYTTQTPLIKYGDKKFIEEKFFFADNSVFDVFDINITKGSAKAALNIPNSIAISESMALKYFGNEEPLGKTITYQNQNDFEVAAVFEDIPSNSHFRFDFLASMEYMIGFWNTYLGVDGRHNNWYWNGAWIYVLMNEKEAAEKFANKTPQFIKKYFPERYQNASLLIRPLTDIHLHSNLTGEIEPNGSITNVYIFSTIAVFILFIACINFINLSIAQGSDRAKEIGVRKVLGAEKFQLISQIIGETLVASFLATAASLILVEIVLPQFQEIFGRNLSLNLLENYWGFLFLICVAVIVGFISGLFPALYLSNFSPVKILKKTMRLNLSYEILRKGLVVLQFSVSIFLIIGMGMIYKQMNFIKNKDLGFNKESVLVVKARPYVNNKFEAFRNELLNSPGVLSVAGTSDIPGAGSNGSRFVPEGISRENPLMLPSTFADYDFLTSLGIELKAGRNFSKEFPTDVSQAFILNEKAVKNLGWEKNAVGKKIELFGPGTDEIVKNGFVIGVIDDYNYESLHNEVKPLVLTYSAYHQYYLIRLDKGNVKNSLASVEKVWNKFSPDWAFEAFFLDNNLEKLYQSDQRLATIVNYFGFLAVLIACLGLYGLAAFAAKKRIKEIGIRKVIGASVPGIIKLLSLDFIKLVLIANVIAFPVAYYAIKSWLEAFAYRINVDFTVFIFAAAITVFIALLTVGIQAVKASLSNPISTLKYE